MKPRIIKLKSLWYCGIPQKRFIGIGFTPKESYTDWINGIATALTVNDKHFSPITIKRGAVVKGGSMTVEVA